MRLRSSSPSSLAANNGSRPIIPPLTIRVLGKIGSKSLLNTMNTPGLANIRLWLLIAAMPLLTTAVLSASFMTTT